MRFEILDTDNYLIYLNSATFRGMDFTNEEDITTQTKLVIMRLKRNYNIYLSGFYQMSIYVGEETGLFIELKKLEEMDFDLMAIDLKVVVYLNQTFLLETDDLDKIKGCLKIIAYEGKYYGVLTKNTDISLLEMGNIIYGTLADLVLSMGAPVGILGD
ncbi:MAG: hypothetical protein RR406_03400 [Bacilli bacterium]